MQEIRQVKRQIQSQRKKSSLSQEVIREVTLESSYGGNKDNLAKEEEMRQGLNTQQNKTQVKPIT